MDWTELGSLGIAVLGIIFGAVFFAKWAQAVKVLKELGDAFTKSAEALEDKRITRDEAIALLNEWLEVYQNVKLLFG